MSKDFSGKDKYLVWKVSIIETMRNIPVGEEALFDAISCGPYTSAKSAATRLAQGGEGAWLVTSDDNGTTYKIRHKA